MKMKSFKLFIIFGLITAITFITSCAGGAPSGGSNNATAGPGNYGEETKPEAPGFDSNEEEIMFGEAYDVVNENPYYKTSYQKDSYFSMDSFTASYSNLRRYIENYQALNGNVIKTDELLNYFTYDLKTPEGEETFAVTAEMGDSPWSNNKILTIGIATEEAEYIESEGNNVVFLIDASGSMSSPNKLPLLKQAFNLLLEKLNPTDRISIVTYASGVRVHADGVYADEKSQLSRTIDSLIASGGTNGSGGIQQAYELAEKYFVPGGINRVVLATDGDFNIGISNNDQLKAMIEEKASSGVYLTVLGFGMGNYQDSKVETLAKYGNGTYAYIDDLDEAKKVLVDDFNKTMITVAKDVKNKISFNPEIVDEYRLIGYENKGISKEDFENEEKDAGELGSGHQTLVTYEIILKDEYKNNLGSTDELFNLQINYKHPTSNVSKTFTHSSTLADLNNVVSEDHVFATCVVEFSLILRNSPYRGTASYEHLLARLSRLDCMTSDSLKAEFRDLVNLAFERGLVAHPAYNQDSGYSIITIVTSFGSVKARYKNGMSITYESVMINIFGKQPQTVQYIIGLDDNFTIIFADQIVNGDLTIYIKQINY